MTSTLKIARLRAYLETLKIMSAQEGIAGRVVQVDRGARYVSLAVRLRDYRQLDKALALAEPLAGHTYTQVVIAQRERGRILYQFELSPHFWEVYTRADLKTGPGKVGVGLSDGRRQVDFAFDPPHVLVAGTTGAGKSETVKSMLVGLFTAYAPGQLAVVIIDPDGDHGDFRNVAHLEGVPIASNPAAIDSALSYAHSQYLERKRSNDRSRPPLVVVIDEAEDALANPARLALAAAMARHGRKYNVNLLLATQKPSESALPGILDKINNRWIGVVQNAHISAYLSGQAGLDCHHLTGKGDLMHVANSQVERLLVAMATNQDYARLPRAEIAPPSELAIEQGPIDPDLDEEEMYYGAGETIGGRPPVTPDPVMVARFRFIGIGKISLSKAREWFGLTRTEWERNRDFALAEEAEWKRLEKLTKGRRDGR